MRVRGGGVRYRVRAATSSAGARGGGGGEAAGRGWAPRTGTPVGRRREAEWAGLSPGGRPAGAPLEGPPRREWGAPGQGGPPELSPGRPPRPEARGDAPGAAEGGPQLPNPGSCPSFLPILVRAGCVPGGTGGCGWVGGSRRWRKPSAEVTSPREPQPGQPLDLGQLLDELSSRCRPGGRAPTPLTGACRIWVNLIWSAAVERAPPLGLLTVEARRLPSRSLSYF